MWEETNDGLTVGELGSEGGIILLDETYRDSCRITLEKCHSYCAITCGCSFLIHTAFSDDETAEQRYEEMKQDLKGFIDVENLDKDMEMFCEYFTNKY